MVKALMPGIFGIITKKAPLQNEDNLCSMSNSMLHKSFYASGTYTNAEHGIYVGWVAHQDAPSSQMPVWNDHKDICLILCGEIFHDACPRTPERSGNAFLDNTPLPNLANRYAREPATFFEKLNGWFSGVIVDFRKKETLLFNDRYGLNRLYFHEDQKTLYFASEAKAILKLFPRLRNIDIIGLGELLCCGCVLQDRTLFTNVHVMPPASKWRFKNKEIVSKEKYFVPAQWENQELLDDRAYYKNLKDTFSRILPRYFRTQQNIGMSLTGGFDGRMIMAWARSSPGQLPCYTFGSMYRTCRDEKIARQIARKCFQPHETIVVDQDFFAQFARLAEDAVYYSDGTMNVTGAVELYVNEIARKISTIRLTGNYGSEILRGNVAFKPVIIDNDLWCRELTDAIKKAGHTYAEEFNCHPLSFIAFKQVPWHHYARLSLEQTQLTVRSPYLDNDLVALAFRATKEQLANTQFAWQLIADGSAALADIPTDLGLVAQPFPIIRNLLHQYEKFTFKAEYAYGYGMPQWLAQLDHFFKIFHFEKIFTGRHKFYHLRPWYRDALSGYIKNILLDSISLNRPYLNRKKVIQMLDGHLKGNRNYTTEITQLLTLELIHRLLIDNI